MNRVHSCCDESTMNCMTLIAGREVSFNHRVLVGHNEDDPGHLAVRHAYVPAQDWDEGSVLPAEEGCAQIPQVPHTFGYYWIEFKADNGGITNADAFANENGVVITTNSMGRSREDMEDASVVRDGGIGYNLRRVLAERARSASDGARVLIDMMETWGYAMSGRAYTIADKDEAFMFQLVRGHHYIGARVPDNAVAVMPNHYNFHTLHDCPEMFYSEDLVSYAIEKGWYVPKQSGDFSDFDFAAAYQHEETWNNPGNMLRQKHSQRLVLRRPWDLETEGVPFVVYPDHPMDVQTFAEVLSNHYEGTEDDCERFGPGRSPHNVPNTRRICTGTTLESNIYVFDERTELLTVYSCLGRPCQLPYLPLHPLSGVPEALREDMDPARMMAEHLKPEPGILCCTDSLRQRMRDLECRLEMVYCDEIDQVRPILAKLLEEAQRENAATVEALRLLLADGDSAAARRCACERDGAFIRRALDVVQAHVDGQASDVRIDALPMLDRAAAPETLTLTLHTGRELRCEGMIFGIEHTDTRQYFAAAKEGSLQRLDADSCRVEFPTAAFLPYLTAAGRHAFWLGGNDAAGRAFAASTIVEVR